MKSLINFHFFVNTRTFRWFTFGTRESPMPEVLGNKWWRPNINLYGTISIDDKVIKEDWVLGGFRRINDMYNREEIMN